MYASTSEASSTTRPCLFSIIASIHLFLELLSFTMHRLHSSTMTTGTSTQGFSVRIGKRLQQYVSAFHRARQARDEIPNTTMKTVQIRETISWYVGKGAY